MSREASALTVSNSFTAASAIFAWNAPQSARFVTVPFPPPFVLQPRILYEPLVQLLGSSSTTAKRRTSGCPVFHTQPRDSGEITVAGDDDTVSQFAGNRCNHDVNLLHRSTNSLQFRCNPPVLFR